MTTLMQASRQWASRPADERFLSLHEMAAKMGGAPVSVLPDAGHLSNIENAEAFNQAALEWLTSRASLGSTPAHWPISTCT